MPQTIYTHYRPYIYHKHPHTTDHINIPHTKLHTYHRPHISDYTQYTEHRSHISDYVHLYPSHTAHTPQTIYTMYVRLHTQHADHTHNGQITKARHMRICHTLTPDTVTHTHGLTPHTFTCMHDRDSTISEEPSEH